MQKATICFHPLDAKELELDGGVVGDSASHAVVAPATYVCSLQDTCFVTFQSKCDMQQNLEDVREFLLLVGQRC